MEKPIIVKFLGEDCTLEREEYVQGGRIGLSLICPDGDPMATCTVNLPCCGMDDDDVAIKDYSENEGMLDALVKAGVVEKPHKFIKSGFVEILVCKLKIQRYDPDAVPSAAF